MQHIIKPLLRRPAMSILMIVQVAIACAIACNALFLLQQKLTPLLATDGVGHPDRLLVVTDLYARGKPWGPAQLRTVEAALRALPGVQAVSYGATFPMTSGGRMSADIRLPGGSSAVPASIFLGDNLLPTLDLRLVAGRDFTAAEKRTIVGSGMGFRHAGPTIITRALADRLFPDGHALGHTFAYRHFTTTPRTVVGIVAHLMGNRPGGGDRDTLDYSMLFPGIARQWPKPRFAVRATAHADLQRLRHAIHAVIQRRLGDRMLPGYTPTVLSFEGLRQRMFAPERSAVWLFAGVTLIVLVVTLAGIVGVTTYGVRQRTRQIGIRRALGARRGDIFRAFQLENLLVVVAGVVLGMLVAYGVNIWLMQHYALARMPWIYLAVGAALFVVLGQLAAVAPARRATAVPPLMATRA